MCYNINKHTHRFMNTLRSSNHQVAFAFLLVLAIFGSLFFIGMTSLKANLVSIQEAQAAQSNE